MENVSKPWTLDVYDQNQITAGKRQYSEKSYLVFKRSKLAYSVNSTALTYFNWGYTTCYDLNSSNVLLMNF